MARKRMAAIDISSNAPRLMIGQEGENGKPVVIETLRASLALGVDTYNNRSISEASLTELCNILKRFKNKLEEYNIKDYRVVATSAVREAVNRDFVLERIKQRTGLVCEILSNSEERYLHNIALTEDFAEFGQLAEKGCILIDLGAGSLQVATYKNNVRRMSQNLKLGYLRMNELFSEVQARDSNYDQVMNDYISSKLISLRQYGLNSEETVSLIAISNDLGYLRNFSDIISFENDYITADELEKLYDFLLRTRPLELTLHYNIPSDIAENLLPIVMIINRFISSLKVDGIYLPEVQLGYGLLLSMAQEKFSYQFTHDHYQDLSAAVDFMVERYGGDLKHLYAKERDALAIYNVLTQKFHFADYFALTLSLAVRMSEVGKFIIPENYEAASGQIIANNEFIGISERSREIIADSVRFSKGNDVPDDFMLNYRSYKYRLQVLQQAAILRVADALEYSSSNKIMEISTHLTKSKLLIKVRTNDDISLERRMLSQRSKLLEELFGLKLEVEEY